MKNTVITMIIAAVILLVISGGCDFVMLPPETEIIHHYLSDLSFIPAPSKDMTPLMFFDHFEYTGAITWKDNKGNFVVGNFKEGIPYTADVFLTPKEGFTFNEFEGSFIHRDAQNVTQFISSKYASISIDFARLKLTDADFISLTGERLKTFTMDFDPTFDADPLIIEYSGTSVYQYSQSQGTTFTNILTATIPFKALFIPDDHIVKYSGRICSGTSSSAQYRNFNVEKSLSLIINIPYFYPYDISEPDNFTCDSYSLPDKGYYADRNYIETKTAFINFPTIPGSLSLSISGLSGGSSQYHTCDLSTSSQAISLAIPFRQYSRDFYIYRSVSIAFDPVIDIVGWTGGDLVESFTFDEETNTLTAHLIDYSEKTLGEVFSLNIVVENGSVLRKVVKIGQ